MYFKEWIIFIIAVSWGIDRYFGFREETGRGLWKFLKKNPLLITSLFIFGFIYLLDIMGGRYVWLAFLLGSGFMLTMIVSSAKGLWRKIKHSLGFGFVLLCFVNVLCYTSYELQTTFHQPCWSPDGKQIAFFMGKNLIQYRLGIIGGWSPNPIWDKYYLCTMDYDGGNFKVVKETESSGYVRWSGSGNIIYTQGSDINNKPEARMYKIRPDGTGVELLWQWDEQTEWHGVTWLSPKEDYMLLNKISEQGKGSEFSYAVYDRNKKQIKKVLTYDKVNLKWYGSYQKNEIALVVSQIDSKNTERVLVKYDIDTDKIERIVITPELAKKEDETLLAGFAMPSLSPDRSMYVGNGPSIWRSTDKKLLAYYSVKDRRSYLFNIFGK